MLVLVLQIHENTLKTAAYTVSVIISLSDLSTSLQPFSHKIKVCLIPVIRNYIIGLMFSPVESSHMLNIKKDQV